MGLTTPFRLKDVRKRTFLARISGTPLMGERKTFKLIRARY